MKAWGHGRAVQCVSELRGNVVQWFGARVAELECLGLDATSVTNSRSLGKFCNLLSLRSCNCEKGGDNSTTSVLGPVQ